MKRLLTAGEMYQCDQAAMRHTPSRTLMERAALACAKQLQASCTETDRIFVLCGGGNNGGDGIACARFLCEGGIRADICIVTAGHALSPACAEQLEAAAAAGVHEVPLTALEEPAAYTAAVDALFGIGLTRPVTGVYADAIETLNRTSLPVLSIDIPSGIHPETGEVMGCAVRARKTVTMAYPKPGLYLYPGTTYAGTVTVADIGIDDAVLPEENRYHILEDNDLAALPPRAPDGNKGTFGRVLIIAGSKNMAGAAYLSAKAAYRTGAGLVRILTPEENRIILQTLLPEAILTTYDTQSPAAACASIWKDAILWADGIVIGPGLGQSRCSAALIETTLAHSRVPTVIDADALRLLADRLDLLPNDIPLILTPHPGELSALTALPITTLRADLRSHAAQFAADHHIILAAKDARTIVTDGSISYLNTSGCSALAKGGSGDVLTGIIAALLVSGMEPLQAAAYGVFLHGRAGELAEKTWGNHGVLAAETADAAAKVLHTLKKFDTTRKGPIIQ